MAFWFGKKRQAVELRQYVLPGETGTISFPTDFTVEMEDDGTLLACPKDGTAISLRVSTLILNRKDGQDETAAKIAVRDDAKRRGLQYREVEDKGLISYESESEQDGVPLLMQYSYVGEKNTFVIFSATIVRTQLASKAVKAVVDLIPQIVESIAITKLRRIVTAEDREVEAVVTTVEPFPQTSTPFGPTDHAWLYRSMELAKALGVKYGSGGDLTPDELDVVFSRWMHDEEKKESDDTVANALGAAFGDYLIEQHGFHWVVVTDEYGTEYAVRHSIGETTAFPRTSVQKRIESRCSEFFQDLYLGVLDQLKRSEEEQKSP